jgi:adenylate cyclase
VLLAARIGASLEKKRLHDREAAHLRRIEQQLQIIERERERSDQLLHAILPAPAVAEPRSRAQVTPRRHADVAVLFADPSWRSPAIARRMRPRRWFANLGTGWRTIAKRW